MLVMQLPEAGVRLGMAKQRIREYLRKAGCKVAGIVMIGRLIDTDSAWRDGVPTRKRSGLMWVSDETEAFLTDVGLSCHVPAFLSKGITLDSLRELTRADLLGLGVTKLGERHNIIEV